MELDKQWLLIFAFADLRLESLTGPTLLCVRVDRISKRLMPLFVSRETMPIWRRPRRSHLCFNADERSRSLAFHPT